MTKENDMAELFFLQSFFYLPATVLVIVTSEVGQPRPDRTAHPPRRELALKNEKLQSSFSWQCFLTVRLQF